MGSEVCRYEEEGRANCERAGGDRSDCGPREPAVVLNHEPWGGEYIYETRRGTGPPSPTTPRRASTPWVFELRPGHLFVYRVFVGDGVELSRR